MIFYSIVGVMAEMTKLISLVAAIISLLLLQNGAASPFLFSSSE